MSDNRTIELLRKLLDERGVKTYHEQNYITWRDANDYQCFAFETYERPGLLRVHCNLTPEQAVAATLGESDEGCYLMRDGTKFPVELDYGFLGIMPITIKVGGFRYLLEVPDGE